MNFFNPIGIILLFLSCFTYFDDDFTSLKKTVLDTYSKYEAEKYMGCKSYSMEITDDGFLRYKKVLNNNKSEFFSVKMERVTDLDFYGTEKGGWILFKCKPGTVIYQSRRDPAGDIDSMANEISFPFREISIEELNSFRENFINLKEKINKIQK